MKLLFNGKYAPLTDEISFIKTNVDDAVKAFEQWTATSYEPILQQKTKFFETFEQLLIESLPFIYPYLSIFFEAKNGWIGHYGNYYNRTNEARNVARILNVPNIEVTAWPSVRGRIVNGWGGGMFHCLFGGEQRRCIMLSEQENGWDFLNQGKPFPFEDVEKYKEKFARNRFTPEMLDKYLKELDIDFFNEDFYMPYGSKAYIIEQVRPPWNEDDKPISLEEMRRWRMYE